MTTLLIAEHEHEVLKDSTNKALTAASQLGGDVHVLVAGGGQGTKAAAEVRPRSSPVLPRCWSPKASPTRTIWPSRWPR